MLHTGGHGIHTLCHVVGQQVRELTQTLSAALLYNGVTKSLGDHLVGRHNSALHQFLRMLHAIQLLCRN